MNVEMIGALVIMAVAAMVIVGTLFAASRQQSSVPAPPVLSAADQRLLAYFKLTQGQWLSLTDFQRAALRERAHRTMN